MKIVQLGILSRSSFDPDSVLYFNQLTGTVSDSFKFATDKLVRQLKSDGNWQYLDRLWIHAAENQQNARVSLVNPSSTNITEVNTPTWTVNQGYTGNGSSSYLDTNFNASGANFTQNSNCSGAYVTNNVQSNSVLGRSDATNTKVTYIWPRYTDNKSYFRSSTNTATDISVANADSRGLFVAARSDASNMQGYKNGSQTVTGAVTSGVMSTNNFYLLCQNNNGTAAGFSSFRIAISFFGSNGINQAALYTALQAFATARGFNV